MAFSVDAIVQRYLHGKERSFGVGKQEEGNQFHLFAMAVMSKGAVVGHILRNASSVINCSTFHFCIGNIHIKFTKFSTVWKICTIHGMKVFTTISIIILQTIAFKLPVLCLTQVTTLWQWQGGLYNFQYMFNACNSSKIAKVLCQWLVTCL